MPTDAPRTARARQLVVIGGLPGAGKTTLLESLVREGLPDVVPLDSEHVAARLRAALPAVPYRVLRPWVHAVHRLRVARAVRGPTPSLLLTDPLTGPRRREALLRAAARAGRTVRILLIDATPGEAAGGQAVRGRALTGRAMCRHVTRWGALLDQARSPSGVPGALTTTVVERAAVGRLTACSVLSPPVTGPRGEAGLLLRAGRDGAGSAAGRNFPDWSV
jgi:AAA domain